MRGVILAVVLATSLAVAGGRAGTRLQVEADGWFLKSYVEESLVKVGGLEIAVGSEFVYPAKVTPYVAGIYTGGNWWFAVEVARNFFRSDGLRFAAQFGVFW